MCWAVILILQTTPSIQDRQPQVGENPDEVSGNLAPQNLPCADQPKSLKELKNIFNAARFPSPSEVNGNWAAIGFVYGHPYQKNSLNCAGVKRGSKFEWVILANGYSIEVDAIGTYNQTTILKPDNKGSVTFSMDFEGDSTPVYRCRITDRGTLACLGSAYGDGVEFKKMVVKQSERYMPKTGQ
jgi:hypothetical protein